MTYSFRTNGNFIDLVHTDNTSLMIESVLKSLHNTSRAIEWSLTDDTTIISFRFDDIEVRDFPIVEIDFDGVAMNSQDDFETNITAMFTGLAVGSPSGGITLDGASPESITNLWAGSQAEYDGLTPDASTLYFIV